MELFGRDQSSVENESVIQFLFFSGGKCFLGGVVGFFGLYFVVVCFGFVLLFCLFVHWGFC